MRALTSLRRVPSAARDDFRQRTPVFQRLVALGDQASDPSPNDATRHSRGPEDSATTVLCPSSRRRAQQPARRRVRNQLGIATLDSPPALAWRVSDAVGHSLRTRTPDAGPVVDAPARYVTRRPGVLGLRPARAGRPQARAPQT